MIANSSTGEILHDHTLHSAAVNSIDLYGNLLISASDDKTVQGS